MRRFLGDEVKRNDTVIVLELHQKHTRIEQVSLLKSTTTEKKSTARLGKEGISEKEDRTEVEDTFQDNQAAEFLSRWKEKRQSKSALRLNELGTKEYR